METKRYRITSPNSLPQVPIFNPIDSPLPPPPVNPRTWEIIAAREQQESNSSPSAGSLNSANTDNINNNYGSDDEEDELRSLSLDELRTRCISLMKAAKSNISLVQSSPRGPPQILSPAMYAVHGRHHGLQGVRRLQLGRTASISTQTELNRLTSDFSGEDEVLVRLNGVLRSNPQQKDYTSTQSFAEDILYLCAKVSTIFERESRVLELKSPIYVFGDTHGNLEDLKFFADNVWPLGMPLTAGGFLFLGDYVDRGSGGLEVLAYLFAQKVQAPYKLFLLRGNHETRSVNGWEEYYGNVSFLAQCKNRFGESMGCQVWEECNRVFDRMPLAAIIDKTIFCVHGGIPRPPTDPNIEDTRLDDIRNIPCPIDVRQPSLNVADTSNRLAFSLLWSDPAATGQEPYLEQDTGFGKSGRGSGSVVFGIRAVEQFLKKFGLGYIMRAHEATANGVAVSKSAKVLTVFSTSKDHGCGGDAKCGCVLVDTRRIVAITRSPDYNGSCSSLISDSSAAPVLSSHSMVSDYRRARGLAHHHHYHFSSKSNVKIHNHKSPEGQPENEHSNDAEKDDDDEFSDEEATTEIF